MITHTEVGGIQTVLAPGTGPLRAGLVFRVGRADETLATAGITHLVEHLALHRHGLTDYHFNGAVATTETHFVVQGSPTEVVDYLNGVCAALGDLPLDRLAVEKEILRTEAAGRGGTSPMPLWRYGARGHGLVGYPEYGLHRVGPDDVTDWARHWFTRQNAVLWLTGDELPEGLDPALPDGVRMPPPAVTSALPQTPAFFTGDQDGVVLDAVVARSTAAMVFSDLFGRALFRELRQQGGLSYQAGCDYARRDADHAVITAVADALPEKREAVLGGFIDTLAALRMGRIDPAELESVRGRALEALDQPDREARGLPDVARGLLLGRPAAETAELRAEIAALTAADLRTVAEEVHAAALLMTPCGTGADWAGLHPAPVASAERVAGDSFSSLVHDDLSLVIGAEGVSLSGAHGQATVRYADCVAALATPDGARRLTGADGVVVGIEPTLFALPPAQLARIDAALPPEAVVPLPARSPEDIPRPPATSTARPGRRPNRWAHGKAADRIANFGDILLGLAFLWLIGSIGSLTRGDVVGAVVGAVGAVLFAVPPLTVRTARRRS